jgi:hypothetical protein
MNIASLQAFLRSQAGFLSSAGGSAAVIKDLEAFVASLAPFESFGIDKVADLLRHASHHRETGEWLPVLSAKKASTRAPRAPKKKPEDLIREAGQRLDALYAQALDPGFRFETVDADMQSFAKLTVAQLTSIAREFGIIDIPKKKADILAALGRKIKGRREFHDRTEINVNESVDEAPAHSAVMDSATGG